MSYTKDHLRAPLPAPLTADQAMLPTLSVETTRNLQTKVCRATIAIDSNTQHAVPAYCIVEASLALVLAKYENSAEICFDVGKAVGHESTTVEHTTHPFKIEIDQSDPIYRYLEKALDAIQCGTDTEGSSFSGIINPDVRDNRANRSRAILVAQSQYNEVQHDKTQSTYHSGPDRGNHQSCLQSVFVLHYLYLEFSLAHDQVDLRAHFDSADISIEKVQAILDVWQYILPQLSESGGERLISSIDFVPPAHKSTLSEWNPLILDESKAGVLDLISNHVSSRPNAPAVHSWDGLLSYAEIDLLSTRFAHHLLELSAGPGVFIAFCFDKSIWAIVSILAIIRSGAAFVAIDPKQPKSRIEILLRASRASIVLAEPSYAQLFDSLGMKVVKVDADFAEIFQDQIEQTRLPEVKSTDAVYIINTSGSTGMPKSIVVEHGQLSSSIPGLALASTLSSDSRVLQFSAYTFDACIHDILATLSYGGCVCVPSEHERLNDLAASIVRMQVNTALLTPSVLRLLYPWEVPCLKRLCAGGEAIPPDLLERWVGHVEFGNSYGPSECVVGCALKRNIHIGDDPNNIGTGIGAILWIVEPECHDHLCPIGCIGELMVEGPLLARGYTDPVLTKVAFIEDPSWAQVQCRPHRRFYKTGDLVKYNWDGTMSFIGRKDTQVKLAGRRIELGEIEHHVSRCEFVNEVIVQLPQHGIYKQQLVAVVTLGIFCESCTTSSQLELLDNTMMSAASTQIERIQDSLAELLPHYMIPRTWIVARTLPLSVTGKLDRASVKQFLVRQMLPIDSSEHGGARNNEKQPLSYNENRLAGIWATALDVDLWTINAQSNFFELGGNSLKAMYLVVQAQRQGIVVTVSEVFSKPVLAELATRLGAMDPLHAELERIQSMLEPFELVGGSIVARDIIGACSSICNLPWDIVEEVHPTTPLQAGLIALSTKNPGTYITHIIFELSSQIDVARFKNAWETCHSEVAILRSLILPSDRYGPCQVVLGTKLDWQRASSLEAFRTCNAKVPIVCGHLLNRFTLVQDDQYFVWSAHHSSYDATSIALILERVEQLYGKTDLPEPLSLVPLVKHIQSTSEASKIYWKSYLAKSEPVQFPRTQGDKGESLPDAMFKTKIPLIRKARSSITDSTMIRAAWALVISCYSGTDDVIFGATLSGRTAAVRGINNVFGPTITTVPVRIKLDYSESVISYLQRVQSESTMMMAFEHLGLQNISSLGHQYRRACDFQNLLVIQPPQTQRALDLLGLARIDTRPGDQQEAQTYPLNVEVELGNSSMGLRVSYNSHLITRVQIDRLTKQFSHVLQRLAIESHQSTVADFELISLQDLCQIQSWNARTPEPFFTSVPAQFLISVDRYPEAIAVTSWDRNFTYCELENASSKLARHLRATGVDIGTTVPVCLDKSAIAVVAILSILRAGGAYVALDPSHPFKRLASIIKGVNATIVVAAPEYTARFLDMSLEVLEFSSDLLDGLEATTSTLLPLVAPTSPAFIQFTSGSTGTPKGIIIEHQALCTSTNAFGSQWGVGHGTKVFQFAAFIFDVSVSDIFTSLMRGACVCMPSEYERMNDTAAAINRLGANYVSLTPGMASLLKPLDVPGLETLILGGEAPTQDNMRTWANKLNLIVCYGPAECSITCSGTEPATVDSEPADIGLPMGSTMWIVDPRNHNRLAPIGCIGEILVEGPILARGYLDDDEKTTASFVTNPSFTRYFGNGIPRRFYKTGDLGCYSSRSDGSMNFVGRKDTQVKLRGQRVELGEVEHHIYASSNVRHAVACVPSSGPFESRLIAVLVVDEENAGSNLSSSTKKRSKLQHTDDGDSDFQLSQIELCSRLSKKQILANISKIDDHLSGNVPRYMVPSTFIFVQRIPLNTSGKLNRQVVKAWLESADDETYQQITRYAEVEESELTLTVNEELVRRICGHVLRIDLSHVRMGQSFLGLGGDSIRAMLVVARTRSEGWIVTVKDILQSKSLSVLANLVVPIEETATAATTEPLKSSYGWVSTASTGVYFYDTAFRQRAINRLGLSNVDEIQAIYPCTPVQNGMLISHAQNSRLYEIKNIFEVKSTENGIVNANRLEEAWRCVVQRQPILRTIFFEEPSAYGIFHQIVVRRDQRPIHRLESSDEDPVEMLFTRNTINYHASTPPNQLTICTTRSARVFVKIDIIHALSDGTTWDLMFRELNAAYEGQLARSCPPQYEEYVSYLTLQPGVVALEYWKAYLTGTPPCNFSTFGGVEDAEPTPRSIGVAFEQSLSMRKVCSDNGITISNFMQAAWCLVLRSYMNRNQICFGYVVSGRDIPLPGIEDSMGTHIGQLPCRIHIEDTDTVLTIAKKMQEDYFDSLPYQHISLVDLYHALGSGAPIYNTNVHYARVTDHGLHKFSTLSFEYLRSIDPTEVSPAPKHIFLCFIDHPQ
jgi:amino acid adenylation domain-containing protein